MKHWILAAAILGAVSLQTAGATALTLDFSNLGGSSISFDGAGNFSFPNSGTYDFDVNGETGGAAALGLFGNISGTFTIGAITTVGSTETAPVTGSGTLSITDASSVVLTANLNWVSIQTTGSSSGTVNEYNTVNLTSISYAGSNADLQALAAPGTGVATVTFQFIPAQDLNALKSTSETNSYSGTMSNVPEPVTFSLMGIGLLGLGLMRKRLR